MYYNYSSSYQFTNKYINYINNIYYYKDNCIYVNYYDK